jgi:hypothetical protein
VVVDDKDKEEKEVADAIKDDGEDGDDDGQCIASSSLNPIVDAAADHNVATFSKCIVLQSRLKLEC